jgi:hypothetical protein
MKTTILIAALLSLSTAVAQDEPQYIGSFFALDPLGKLIPLERQSVTFHAKTRALPGYASVKMIAEIQHGHSPVRVPSDARLIVNGRSPMDPASRFELKILKASKSHREFVMTRAHGTLLGAAAESTLDEGAVPLRFAEYGVRSYVITPQNTLAPGEYAISLRGSVLDLYCFEVQ